MDTPTSTPRPKGDVCRAPICGVVSATAPLLGGGLSLLLYLLTGSFEWLIFGFPFSLICGVTLAFVAWSRGERFIWLGWIGLLFNSALLLYSIFEGHLFSFHI